jgi:hypothetical protein
MTKCEFELAYSFLHEDATSMLVLLIDTSFMSHVACVNFLSRPLLDDTDLVVHRSACTNASVFFKFLPCRYESKSFFLYAGLSIFGSI